MAATLWHHTPIHHQPLSHTDMQPKNLTPHQLVTLAPTLSIAEWQIKVRECLENTDQAIHSLLADIPRQPR